MQYLSVPPNETESVVVENYDKNIRSNVKISYEEKVFEDKTCIEDTTNPKQKISYLAISGGSDNGAYAAGFLKGWTKSGIRPEFKIVTGVSTGAIIAPFAFLGSDYDAVLEEAYTSMKEESVFVSTLVDIVDGMINGYSLADTRPLRENLKKYITQDVIDKIAVENAKGRKLYISTTNLDTQQSVIWDIGAIAASKEKDSLNMVINVILASAALPGIFPPIFFDVTANGKHYKEIHVDGGIVSQLLLPPETYTKHCNANRTLYLIRNCKLHSEYKVVKPRTFEIFSRSMSSTIKYQAYGDLYRMYLASKNNNIDYNLAVIPDDFEYKGKETSAVIDGEYMKALFKRAYEDSVHGYVWKKNPF